MLGQWAVFVLPLLLILNKSLCSNNVIFRGGALKEYGHGNVCVNMHRSVSCPSREKRPLPARDCFYSLFGVSVCVCLTLPVRICFCCPPGMVLYNIFIITIHVTGLLFIFLLPYFSSVYVRPGSVSANSAVAIPGITRASHCLCSTAPSLGQGRRAIPCTAH